MKKVSKNCLRHKKMETTESVGKSDRWIRTWLWQKLENFQYRIKNKNSYGSMKKIGTLRKDLLNIVDQLDGYR